MIAELLIQIAVDRETDPASSYGISLAKLFGARATGVAFGLEPTVAAGYFGAVPGEFMLDLRKDAERAARAAADGFRKSAEGAGIDVTALAYTSTVDGAANQFGRLARLYDLAVVGQPNPDRPGPEQLFLESALFDSGRGVLVVPYIQKKPVALDRVLVAWDGGRAATRAIAEARPILARAKHVEILVVETGKPDAEQIPGADLAKHLARHKLNVELRRVLASSASEIDETILNAVTDDGIDFVVMGGYGHSRVREFVLGGVTRSIIESMTAPVLMAH